MKCFQKLLIEIGIRNLIKLYVVMTIWLLILLSSCTRVNSVKGNAESRGILAKDEVQDQRANDKPDGWLDFRVLERQRWVVVDYSNRMWQTRDAGKTWQKKFEAKSLIRCPSFLDVQNGYVLVDGKLFHTTDSGENWGESKDLTSKGVVRVEYPRRDSLFLIGPDEHLGAEIYKSTNDGNDVRQAMIGSPNVEEPPSWSIKDLKFWRDIGVAAGNARVLISRDFGDIWRDFGSIEGRFERVSVSNNGLFLLVEYVVGESLIFDANSKKVSNVSLPKERQHNGYLSLSSSGHFYFLTIYGELFQSIDGKKWQPIAIEDRDWITARNQIPENEGFPQMFIGESFNNELLAIMVTESRRSILVFEPLKGK